MKKIIQFLMGCSISISLVSCAKNEVRPSDLKNVTVDYKEEYKKLVTSNPKEYCKDSFDVEKCELSLPNCVNGNPDACSDVDPLFHISGGFLAPREHFVSYLYTHDIYTKACNCLLYTSPSPRDRG